MTDFPRAEANGAPEPVSPAPEGAVQAIGGYFDAVGQAVEGAWSARRNNEDEFPEVTARVLAEIEPPTEVNAVDVLELLTEARRLIPQEPLGFGQPPITLYQSRDFSVSALVWLDGTTTIHQHRFSGAFRVLVGSSIHAVYRYAPREVVTRRLVLGDLGFQAAELLRQGDVRPIAAGSAFIHALFHLDRPSITVVVRTHSETLGIPQYNYLQPGLAYDQWFEDETLARQLLGLQALHAFAPEDALRCAKQMVRVGDFLQAFLVTRDWFRFDRSEHLDALVDAAVVAHGSVAHILRPLYEEKRRQHNIIVRRRLLKDPRHRLLLALVLNLPGRAAIDAILRGLYPGEAPGAVIARCVDELSSPEHRGLSGLWLSDEQRAAVQALLHGHPADAGSAASPIAGLRSSVVDTPLLDVLLS